MDETSPPQPPVAAAAVAAQGTPAPPHPPTAAAAQPCTPLPPPQPPPAAAAGGVPSTPPPTPLEQRTWRRAAQTRLRSTLTSFKEARSTFSAASDSGLTAATRLVNLLLRGAYLPRRPLGVLAERREVVVAAGGKLLRQQRGALEEVVAAVAQAAAAVQAIWCALQDLQQLLAPASPWQASTPVFHVTPLPQAIDLLHQVALLHARELAAQQHLLLGFQAESALAWAAAGPQQQAAAGVAAPCLAAGQLPSPPAWQGDVLDPPKMTWQQAQQQLAALGLAPEALTEDAQQLAASSVAAVEGQGTASAAAAAPGHPADSSSSSSSSSRVVGHPPATLAHGSGSTAPDGAAVGQLGLEHASAFAFSAALSSRPTDRRRHPPPAAGAAGGDEGDALRSCLFVPLSVWKAAACLEGGRVGDVLQLLTDDMAGF